MTISTPLRTRNHALADPARPEVAVDYRSGVIALAGEYDLANAEQISQAIALLSFGDVVVDLRGVTFIDVCGCRTLTDAQDRLGRQGRRLTLVVDRALIRETLQLVATGVLPELVPS